MYGLPLLLQTPLIISYIYFGGGGYTEAYRDIDPIQATIRKSYCSNDILESVTLDAQTFLSLTPLVKTSSCIKLWRSHEYHSKYR